MVHTQHTVSFWVVQFVSMWPSGVERRRALQTKHFILGSAWSFPRMSLNAVSSFMDITINSVEYESVLRSSHITFHVEVTWLLAWLFQSLDFRPRRPRELNFFSIYIPSDARISTKFEEKYCKFLNSCVVVIAWSRDLEYGLSDSKPAFSRSLIFLEENKTQLWHVWFYPFIYFPIFGSRLGWKDFLLFKFVPINELKQGIK